MLSLNLLEIEAMPSSSYTVLKRIDNRLDSVGISKKIAELLIKTNKLFALSPSY